MPISQHVPTLLAAARPLAVPAEHECLAREVLTSLAIVRIATAGSLLDAFASSGLTEELLDTWCAAGLLMKRNAFDDLTAHALSCISLGRAGARSLAMATGRVIPAPKRVASTRKTAHDAEVGDTGLAILALARAGHIRLRGVEFDDKRIGTSIATAIPGVGPKRIALQADAYVVRDTSEGPVALLIEIDRGTTSVKRLAEKYAGYLAWKDQGGPIRDFGVKAMRVVTIAPQDRRSRALHDAALAANYGKRSGFLLFLEREAIDVREPSKLLLPVARPLGNAPDARVPLFDKNAGCRDPQASRSPLGGNPPERELATRSMPGAPAISRRPPAVTARTQALTLWSAPGSSLARGTGDAAPVAPDGDHGMREGGTPRQKLAMTSEPTPTC